MKKGSSDRLTPAQQAEIEALAALPDDKIDTQNIPEVFLEFRKVVSWLMSSMHTEDDMAG